MSEKKNVEDPCCRLAERHGYLHFKFDRPRGKKGWPDRGFWGHGGRHFLVEFKAPGGKLSKLQMVWGMRFTDRGHGYYVIRSPEEFRRLLAAM